MTHRVVSPKDRASSGITDGMIRMSVWLESADDIVAYLDRALNG